MKLRVLVVSLFLAATLFAATANSALSGRWHFLAEKSKGGEHFPPDTTLVVKQYGSRIYFEYWANNRVFQRDEYRTDGKSVKLYKNANEEVFVDGRLSKNELRLTTHHIIENEIGSQSFDDMDSWVMSKDGKSLIFHSSDGKNMQFQREAANAAATTTAPPPAAKK